MHNGAVVDGRKLKEPEQQPPHWKRPNGHNNSNRNSNGPSTRPCGTNGSPHAVNNKRKILMGVFPGSPARGRGTASKEGPAMRARFNVLGSFIKTCPLGPGSQQRGTRTGTRREHCLFTRLARRQKGSARLHRRCRRRGKQKKA